jgi:hypothetical protein
LPTKEKSVPVDGQKYEEIGFLKYSGESLQAGIIDAGSAGSALVGLDEAIRFFNVQQSPTFAAIEYDVPVQIRVGSWEAVLFGSVGAVGGAFALGYAKKAGEKFAENDFKDIGFRQVLSKSMAALQSLAKLIKHTRKKSGWELSRVDPTMDVNSVVIRNDLNAEITIPMEFFRWYRQMPPRLLVKMTSVIRRDRVLTIGVMRGKELEVVTISESEKMLFDGDDEKIVDEETLFPELIHGSSVALEGRLIRGNEASNSFGLEYMGHVINCVPSMGSVRQYKAALFLHCRVEGRVNRHAKIRFVADRRPTLIVDRVVPLETDNQSRLFDDLPIG